ncbi:MAG TPA: type II toxin-antitoxin system VapC family toxin [Rhizomicrobium sp.]
MNTPLLLDTCACLWIVADELSDSAVAALGSAFDAGISIFVSPITAWEVGTLARKGRFKSHLRPQRWFEKLMSAPGTALAEMTPELLLESSFLPGNLHKDPADRILAATARQYGYTLMTRDRALLDYARQGHLSVLEC